MDKFCIIACLVVVGLCLISLPAEGYVAGYRFTDMTDIGLQNSWEKRRTQKEKDEQWKKEEETDGETMIDGPKNTEDGGRRDTIFTRTYQDIDDNALATKDQYSEKRAPLTNEHHNNENDINAYNTAGITVADVMIIK